MAHASQLIETDILAYLKSQEQKSLLRFITCGSVDDGKSTLIGRLLYESKMIYDDQLTALRQDSKKMGTQGQDIDFALLVDGLASEREQGITIDVAYRYFSTDKRKFIVADTPGHEEYTRNMATGASTAQLAILMVDARQGILTQTRRHSMIVKLLGVKQVVLAINKMDLVGYSESIFDQIVLDYREFAKQIGLNHVDAIPVSALKGDNITQTSNDMRWYTGSSLMHYLETVPIQAFDDTSLFSMPVQWVNRPHLDFRGFSGQITSGTIAVGDAVRVLPSKKTTTVAAIVTMDGEPSQAIQGESVTLTLNDDIDISRGDLIVAQSYTIPTGHRFSSTLVWMSADEMVPGQSYWIKIRAKLLLGTISPPDYKINMTTLEHDPSDTLSLNEIGQCTCTFDQEIAYEAYQDNSHLGSFIIIDRETNNTVGMGLIETSVDEATWTAQYIRDRDTYWSKGMVPASLRMQKNGHRPMMVILTGMVTQDQYYTVGTAIETALVQADVQAYRYGFQFMRQVDADNVDTLRRDMIRRLVDVGYAFMDAGMVFICAIRQFVGDEPAIIQTMVAPFDALVIDVSSDDPVKITQSIKDAICL